MLNKEKIEKCIFDVINEETKISENIIQTLRKLDLCLERRISQGSPAGKEVRLNIQKLIKNKETLNNLFLKRLEMIGIANILRKKTIKNLIS